MKKNKKDTKKKREPRTTTTSRRITGRPGTASSLKPGKWKVANTFTQVQVSLE